MVYNTFWIKQSEVLLDPVNSLSCLLGEGAYFTSSETSIGIITKISHDNTQKQTKNSQNPDKIRQLCFKNMKSSEIGDLAT